MPFLLRISMYLSIQIFTKQMNYTTLPEYLNIPRTLNACLNRYLHHTVRPTFKTYRTEQRFVQCTPRAYNLMLLYMHIYCLFLVSDCWTKITNENFVLRCCARALRHSSRPLVFFMSSAWFSQSVARLQSLYGTAQTTSRPANVAIRELCAAAYSSLYSPLMLDYSSSSFSVHRSLSFGQHYTKRFARFV